MSQLTIFDRYPNTPGFKARGTSERAAKAVASKTPGIKARILAVMKSSDFTADECAEFLSLSILAVRPRFSELLREGKIEPTGAERLNDSGKAAFVYRLKR